MSYSTYFMNKGDSVPCMKCGKEFILDFDPPKCCIDEQDSFRNMCGCQGAPEPIFCDECWSKLWKEVRDESDGSS